MTTKKSTKKHSPEKKELAKAISASSSYKEESVGWFPGDMSMTMKEFINLSLMTLKNHASVLLV